MIYDKEQREFKAEQKRLGRIPNQVSEEAIQKYLAFLEFVYNETKDGYKQLKTSIPLKFKINQAVLYYMTEDNYLQRSHLKNSFTYKWIKEKPDDDMALDLYNLVKRKQNESKSKTRIISSVPANLKPFIRDIDTFKKYEELFNKLYEQGQNNGLAIIDKTISDLVDKNFIDTIVALRIMEKSEFAEDMYKWVWETGPTKLLIKTFLDKLTMQKIQDVSKKVKEKSLNISNETKENILQGLKLIKEKIQETPKFSIQTLLQENGIKYYVNIPPILYKLNIVGKDIIGHKWLIDEPTEQNVVDIINYIYGSRNIPTKNNKEVPEIKKEKNINPIMKFLKKEFEDLEVKLIDVPEFVKWKEIGELLNNFSNS